MFRSRGEVFSPLFIYKLCVKKSCGGFESLICQKLFYIKYLYFSVILQQKHWNFDLMDNTYVLMHLCIQTYPYVCFICTKDIHSSPYHYLVCNTLPFIPQENNSNAWLCITNWLCLHSCCRVVYVLIAFRTIKTAVYYVGICWTLDRIDFNIKSVIEFVRFPQVCCLHHFDAIWMQR